MPMSDSSEVDGLFPPLILSYSLDCNCFRSSTVCLAEFELRQEIEEVESDSLADLLMDDFDVLPEMDSDSDLSSLSTSPAPSSPAPRPHVVAAPSLSIATPALPDLHTEYFAIKGAAWEERYQRALRHCSNVKAKKEDIPIRVLPESDNVTDKNAHKFEAFQDGKWAILGYCELAKLPKLIKALKNKEIQSIAITNIRRTWVPMISSFSFSAGLHIVKCGAWAKNDPRNRYNATINV